MDDKRSINFNHYATGGSVLTVVFEPTAIYRHSYSCSRKFVWLYRLYESCTLHIYAWMKFTIRLFLSEKSVPE
jgi:hypothetical protein